MWCRLIPQAVATLNMLRPSRFVAYYAKAKRKTNWSDHGIQGWYIGPSMHHYRNYKIYIPSTKSTRNCPTVVFLPQNFPFCATSFQDRIAAALEDLKHELDNPKPPTPSISLNTVRDPFKHTVGALAILSSVFKRQQPSLINNHSHMIARNYFYNTIFESTLS